MNRAKQSLRGGSNRSEAGAIAPLAERREKRAGGKCELKPLTLVISQSGVADRLVELADPRAAYIAEFNARCGGRGLSAKAG